MSYPICPHGRETHRTLCESCPAVRCIDCLHFGGVDHDDPHPAAQWIGRCPIFLQPRHGYTKRTCPAFERKYISEADNVGAVFSGKKP